MTVFGRLRQFYLQRFGPGKIVVEASLRRAAALRRRGCLSAATRILWKLQREYGVYVAPGARYEDDLVLAHPVGVVIGQGVIIGHRVTIYQGVTLGAREIGPDCAYPQVGDDTVIYSGAVIIGPVKIGRNCVIGANSVVVKDVPENCVAVGAPARCFPNKRLPKRDEG